MKIHASVVNEALRWGVPLRRDSKGYYHIVNPATGKVVSTSIHPTAKSGLLLIRRYHKLKTNPNRRVGATALVGLAVTGSRKRKVARKVPKVSKKKRLVRSNPTSRDMRKAVRLYTDFTGEDPKYIDEWTVTVPSHALKVGMVTGILYKAQMDGKTQEFMHEFTGASRPILAASADGRSLLLLGGDYKFTEHGIVDGSYSIRRP